MRIRQSSFLNIRSDPHRPRVVGLYVTGSDGTLLASAGLGADARKSIADLSSLAVGAIAGNSEIAGLCTYSGWVRRYRGTVLPTSIDWLKDAIEKKSSSDGI